MLKKEKEKSVLFHDLNLLVNLLQCILGMIGPLLGTLQVFQQTLGLGGKSVRISPLFLDLRRCLGQLIDQVCVDCPELRVLMNQSLLSVKQLTDLLCVVHSGGQLLS